MIGQHREVCREARKHIEPDFYPIALLLQKYALYSEAYNFKKISRRPFGHCTATVKK
jgi:hypothetical protein